MHLRRPAVSIGLALAASACTSTGDPGEPAALGGEAPVEARFGLVVLTHEGDEAGVSVSGQLLTTRGQDREAALHALTQPEQAWLALEAIEPGTCRAIRTEHGALPPGSSIDLHSVGDLVVTAPGHRDTPLVLPPRDFPPVSFGVGGVVYDADAPEVLPYRAGGLYQIAATGDELGPFGGGVVAPEGVELEALAFDDDGLRVRWRAETDTLVIVSRDTGSDTVGVMCHRRDAELLVPKDALALLGPGDAQLVAARVRRAPLLVDGLAHAELLFITRHTIDLTVPEQRPASPDGRP